MSHLEYFLSTQMCIPNYLLQNSSCGQVSIVPCPFFPQLPVSLCPARLVKTHRPKQVSFLLHSEPHRDFRFYQNYPLLLVCHGTLSDLHMCHQFDIQMGNYHSNHFKYYALSTPPQGNYPRPNVV